ncbi:DNase I-like protein [Suillus clintonianus]|uniref:DNase I-like protein n=1 Tax=Suillus clintonianus TaxID=1904413 RepID=UPI001B85C863|nr:DNase I-like protein [Suillus clintonianus]KAG2134783.1 DNase I-like protein [Suillus clintonianus]
METAVRSLLRSSEDLKAALEVEVAQELGDLPSSSAAERSRRVLAVVSHRGDYVGDEEGSVLILKRTPGRSVEDLSIEVAYPISGSFSFSVAQARRTTLDLRASVGETGATLDQSRSELTLTIKYELATETRSHTLIARDTRKLQCFTAECRRLKDIFTRNEFAADFSWLSLYTQQSSLKSLSSPIDLRTINTPLHTRLSPASAGLPGDDAADIDIVREHWIYNKAIEEASTGSSARLLIRTGTFNINGKTPSQDLSPWLRPTKRNSEISGWISPLKSISPLNMLSDPIDEQVASSLGASSVRLAHESLNNEALASDPDLFVLGFQELDLSTEALLYGTSTVKEDTWVEAIFAGLGERGILYEKLASKQLVGMLIVAIAKKSCLSCFGDIRFSAAGAGIMGIMGNKGATAIRMSYTPFAQEFSPSPIVLTFVNAHLAAFDEMVERRNFDFHELSKRLVFDQTDGLDSDANTALETPRKVAGLFESDVLFWMVRCNLLLDYFTHPFGILGRLVDYHSTRRMTNSVVKDLNYRIDLADGDVRELLSPSPGTGNIPLLLKYDQLKMAIASGKAFNGFSEHAITHMPSYRYASNTPQDSLGYDRKRKPAWTDRILHMSAPNVPVTQRSYRSHPQITMSDHRPVSADFELNVSTIDKERREIAASKLYRELWGVEQSSKTPKIKLQPMALDFGKVYYRRLVRQTLSIQNDGQIPCVYRFVAADAEQPICPQWLKINPVAGLLRPGESLTTTVTVFVDNSSGSRLNLAPPRLDFTLILHTALGKDHFISVAGEYQYTCFANKLSRLTRLPGPARTVMSPNDRVSERQSVNAPREIMQLINWLMTHVTDLNLFNGPPEESICMNIRECLDTGDQFPSLKSGEEHGPLATAITSTLVQLLDSLVDPVVPPYLHARCLQMTSRDEAFELLDEFPPESVNVWISLTAFLHYMSLQKLPSQSSTDQADMAERLAAVFAPLLLRDDATGLHIPVSPIGKRKFLLHFIG